MKTKAIFFPLIGMTIFSVILAGCGINSGPSSSGQSTNSPSAAEIETYLTQQARSTSIPTPVDPASIVFSLTPEAAELEWVNMEASDPAAFEVESGSYQLVEIMAFWCEECRLLNPLLKQMEAKWGDKVNFVYLNVDDPMNSNHLQRLSRLKVVPEVILLNGNGEVIKDWVGPPSEADLTSALENLP